ncbi:MAG: hydroxyacylglutathione hydrolase [Gammaproteobacteria bacterium]
MLKIIPLPALKDNYIWLIIHTNSHHCLIIDPGAAKPVLTALAHHALQPLGILLTHHHADHVQGVAEILEHFAMPVFGPERDNIPSVTHSLQDQTPLSFSEMSLSLQTLAIPGHTLGHMAYYGAGRLFSGDTLFTGGCGRVFEGTPTQMYHSLQKLAQLPSDTLVYCGHEYTLQNLQFAQRVEPHNSAITERVLSARAAQAQQIPTVPAPLSLELQTNPFLRCDQPTVREAAIQHAGKSLSTAEEVFATIRAWKNSAT